MAIYMATMQSISRSRGQSAVASAAYRSGMKLADKRYGKVQNYESRRGILSADIILPKCLMGDGTVVVNRENLWNLAESTEKRKDARVAREWIVNLPYELSPEVRKQMAHEFSQTLADKYGVIADCCLHRPSDKEVARGADPRNFHAHILLTTRQAQFANGELVLGEKASIELSDSKRRSLGMTRVSDEIVELRQLWEQIANRYLLQYGIELIDSRSYADRDLDIIPEVKMGKQATQLERDGITTDKGDLNRLIRQRNTEVAAAYELALTSSQHRIAETQRATATNAATTSIRHAGIAILNFTLDGNTRTANDNQQRLATTQSAITGAERAIAQSQRTATTNTANAERRAQQAQAINNNLTATTERLNNSQRRITYTELLVAQLTTATDRNTKRATQATQRINQAQPTVADTDNFIDQSKQSLIRTYTAHIDNPRTIERTQRQTDKTDSLLERASDLIERTKSAIAGSARTIQSAYHRVKQYLTRNIALEAHRKAIEAQQQKSDREVAEQQNIAHRQAFERYLHPRVEQHFTAIQQTGIEFDYPLEQYALYRATKAITALHTAIEDRQTEHMLTAFNDYQLTIKGDGVTRGDRQTNELARQGKLSLLQKFRQRDLYGYTHYEWDKPKQLELKLQAIDLAKQCQQQVKHLLAFAVEHQVITADQQKTMTETLENLDSSLTYHEKEATGYWVRFTQPKPATSRDSGYSPSP